tara:strand:- start:5019 stop:5516 length:498 start_codon:yes stop_codon:yes gene_type:complete
MSFFFGDLQEGVNAEQFLCKLYKKEKSELYYIHSLVCLLDNEVVGIAQSYDMRYFERPTDDIPEEKLRYFNDFFDHRIDNSLYLHALGVYKHARGYGIGTKLLDATCNKAKKLNLSKISLHAWSDNILAIKLYKKYGFKIKKVIKIKNHPKLNHTSGITLMEYAL